MINGFLCRAACVAICLRRCGWLKPSTNIKITCVLSSSRRYSSTSSASRPASLPVVTTKLNTSPLGRPRLKNEKPTPPLCDITAMPAPRLSAGCSSPSKCTTVGLKVAASGICPFRKPSALGPSTAMRWRATISLIVCCRASPTSLFSSAKPELMTMAARIPRAAHDSSAVPTWAAGIVMIARSTAWGSASTDG